MGALFDAVKVTASMSFLYHLVPKSSWDQCKAHREAYYPPTYKQDGFIHLTKDPQFLIGVANNFYLAKDPWEWICLRIDSAALQAPVKFEPAAPVGTTAPPDAWTQDGQAQPQPLFPHLYGTIDFDAVLQEHAVQRDAESGKYLGIDGVTSR